MRGDLKTTFLREYRVLYIDGYSTSKVMIHKQSTNSMEQNISLEAESRSAGQECPAFYRIRLFLSVLTEVRYWSLF
jgi:hypothetical protein